jgi:hypothetical protein
LSAGAGWARDRGTRFYRTAALMAIGVAICGFFLTYLQPIASGRFAGPSEAHLHGFLLASWLVLVAVQTFLLPGHRKLGWLALALAPAVAASTVGIGIAATRRDLAEGIVLGMAGNVTAPLLYLALVLGAIAMRKRPQWHKRLVLIATVVMLWPAWFRWRHFLPWVPRPDITLGLIVADLPIVVAMVRDRLRFGAVHPAYWWVGLPVICEQTFEALAFGTPFWTRFGMWLYGLLG